MLGWWHVLGNRVLIGQLHICLDAKMYIAFNLFLLKIGSNYTSFQICIDLRGQ